MKTKLPSCFAAFIFCFFVVPIFAGIDNRAGTSALEFLNVGIGARAAAMGGALTGTGGDSNSIFWNPAGISRIGQPEASFTYNKWIADINQQVVTYVKPTAGGAFGAGIVYFNMGELTGRDNTGERIPNFTAYDTEGIISYSRCWEYLSLGANLKIIREKIEEQNVTEAAVDLGAVYKMPVKNLSGSFSAQNIGRRVKFIDESFPLPLAAKAGVGWHGFGGRLNFALDLIKPKYGKYRLNCGAECGIEKSLFLRAGYRFHSDYGEGYSFGLGLKPGNWRLDYAYLPCEYFEDAHQFTFSIFLGQSQRDTEAELKRRELKKETIYLQQERKKLEEEKTALENERKKLVLADAGLFELERSEGITIERKIGEVDVSTGGTVTKEETIKITIMEGGIKFPTGSASITPDCFPVLDKIADVIKNHPDYYTEIIVYADTTDITDGNKILSQQRAERIKDYFVLKFGLTDKNFSCKGGTRQYDAEYFLNNHLKQ